MVASAAHLPSGLPSLVPWSWIASRVFLAIMMFLGWLAWRCGESLTGLADEALHGAKAGGRNNVVLAADVLAAD